MKTSRFTEEKIVHAIRQAEGGESMIEVCRRLGISRPTFYTWKRKYLGLDSTDLKRTWQLEDKNKKLKN